MGGALIFRFNLSKVGSPQPKMDVG